MQLKKNNNVTCS